MISSNDMAQLHQLRYKLCKDKKRRCLYTIDDVMYY